MRQTLAESERRPRRLLRLLWATSRVVSAVLALCVAAAWCLDRRSADIRWWTAGGPVLGTQTGLLVARVDGMIVIARANVPGPGWGRAPPGEWTAGAVGWVFVFGDNEPRVDFAHLGLVFLRGPADFDPPTWALFVPDWMPFVAFAAAPSVAILRQWRRRRNAARGRCRRCGYDLHATPDRCPECGMHHRLAPAPPGQ